MVGVIRAHKPSFICHRGPHIPMKQRVQLQKVLKHYLPTVVYRSSLIFLCWSFLMARPNFQDHLFFSMAQSHPMQSSSTSGILLDEVLHKLYLKQSFSPTSEGYLFFFPFLEGNSFPWSLSLLRKIYCPLFLVWSSSGQLYLTNSGNPFCFFEICQV